MRAAGLRSGLRSSCPRDSRDIWPTPKRFNAVSSDKEGSEEAIEQERDVEASPDVVPADEEDEELEEEAEVEEEDRETDDIKEREDEKPTNG